MNYRKIANIFLFLCLAVAVSLLVGGSGLAGAAAPTIAMDED